MSSSPFDPITSGLTDLAGAVGVLTTPRLHPMDGDTAERADDLAQSLSHSAVQTEDWLAGLVETSQAQAELDHKLSSCMTPAALAEWKTRIARLGDRAQQMAEISPYLAEEKKRREALAAHAAGTFSTLPDAPGSCDVSSSMTGEQTDQGGKTKQGDEDRTPQGLGGALEEEGTAPDPESGADETPVTMTPSAPEAPVTMSTGAPETPVTMSDAAANTELSSSTMTSDPAARAALSQPMTQGTPSVGQPSPAVTSPTGGAAPQLSPTQGAAQRGGTAPRSPQQRSEARDRQDERDAAVQAAAGVTMAGAGGAVGAAMTSTPSSPGTATSGAQTAPSTPNAAPAPQGTPPAGTGAGMAGMPRGGSLGSGNGVSNPKPVLASEQPLTPEELDKLIKGEDDKKDGSK